MFTEREWFPEEKQSSLCGANGDPPIPGEKLRNSSDGILRNIRSANSRVLPRLHSSSGVRGPGCSSVVECLVAAGDQGLQDFALDLAPAASNPVDFNITGQVVRLSGDEAEVDCFGGDKIVMLRSRTKGKWGLLQEGQWFRGTALICESGEVLKASITSRVSPPNLISDNGIDRFYAKILRAELTTNK
jgi:hypothetical protein